MSGFRSLCLLLGLCAIALPASADELVIDAIKDAPPNSPAGVPRPTNGMTMDAVRSRFGEPQKRIAAVGQPPISRWIYPDFTVYFEKNLVIHSVINHPRK